VGDACEEAAPIDTTPPRVEGTSPLSNATGVTPIANVTATFSEHDDPGEKGMMVSSINGQTFKLVKKGSTTKIAAAVSYNASTDTATLDPTNNLRSGVTYKAVVTTGAKDAAGNSLPQQYRWFFTVR
jgi:hypothetical protein